jgi:hypothetical protein
MTKAELDDALATVQIMFPPVGLTTIVNGEKLAERKPVREFETTLRTPVGAELKIRDRVAWIRLTSAPDETAHLTMGIPVVAMLEGGDRWHADIGQKVPLNIDRDNVTPPTCGRCDGAADNAHDLLTEADASNDWTTDGVGLQVGAAGRHSAQPPLREKRVAYDMSDPEANKIAVSEGYTLVHGGHLPGGAWKNVKSHGLILPAGQVTPSPKPYMPGQANTRQVEPVEKWTHGMIKIANLAKTIEKTVDADIEVRSSTTLTA